jgi:hypothetical protein
MITRSVVKYSNEFFESSNKKKVFWDINNSEWNYSFTEGDFVCLIPKGTWANTYRPRAIAVYHSSDEKINITVGGVDSVFIGGGKIKSGDAVELDFSRIQENKGITTITFGLGNFKITKIKFIEEVFEGETNNSVENLCAGGISSHTEVFDNNKNNYYQGSGLPVDWWYEFSTPQIVNRYTLYIYDQAHTMSKTWTFDGWNGKKWVTLDSYTNIAKWSNGEKRTFDFTNSTAYIKYRVHVTDTEQGHWYSMGEIEMFNKSLAIKDDSTPAMKKKQEKQQRKEIQTKIIEGDIESLTLIDLLDVLLRIPKDTAQKVVQILQEESAKKEPNYCSCYASIREVDIKKTAALRIIGLLVFAQKLNPQTFQKISIQDIINTKIPLSLFAK